jgi:transcriptional regulator with XRE-family HTH domain
MTEQNVSRAELARRLTTSRAWVTKLLRGNANFTLHTMVKVSTALQGVLHSHIADRGAITRWIDTPENKIVDFGPVAGRPIGNVVTSRRRADSGNQFVEAAS